MGKSFDELSKALATGTKRRTALKQVVAGAFGAAMASVLPGRNAEAAQEHNGRRIDLSDRLCRKYCRERTSSGTEFNACVDECTSIYDENPPERTEIFSGNKNEFCISLCVNGTSINSTLLPAR